MAGGHIAIRRSPEMYLVGYALSRSSTPDGRPPPWLGVTSWNEAYDLFFPALGHGRSDSAFRNSLKNARDSFDGFFENGRIGWRQSKKVDRPPAPNRQVEQTIAKWDARSEAELREAVLDLIVGLKLAMPSSHDEGFDPYEETDARRRVLAEVARRQGQRAFRRKLIEAYGGACAVSGCDILAVLQAAHILPYTGPHRNVVTNGLLLRADLHTLFDLRLLTVAPLTMKVEIAEPLRPSAYGDLHGRQLRLPSDSKDHPDVTALTIIGV